MIDVENEVYTLVASVLREQFPGISVYSKLNLSPASFPCVCFVEAENAVYRRAQDSAGLEHYASVMYEVNVMSSKSSGAKNECKAIFSVIDGVMAENGFIRTAKIPVDEEAPIMYRLCGRYKGVVSENKEISTR